MKQLLIYPRFAARGSPGVARRAKQGASNLSPFLFRLEHAGLSRRRLSMFPEDGFWIPIAI